MTKEEVASLLDGEVQSITIKGKELTVIRTVPKEGPLKGLNFQWGEEAFFINVQNWDPAFLFDYLTERLNAKLEV